MKRSKTEVLNINQEVWKNVHNAYFYVKLLAQSCYTKILGCFDNNSAYLNAWTLNSYGNPIFVVTCLFNIVAVLDLK